MNKLLAQSQKQMEQLGQFSDMIMKQAKAFGEDYIKDRAEGQAARLDMDPSTFSPEAVDEYNRTMAELKLAGMNADEAAAQALRATQNYEVAQRYQALGQYQRVGFAMQHMQEKKIEWPSRLQDSMSNDNTTQITRPDGSLLLHNGQCRTATLLSVQLLPLCCTRVSSRMLVCPSLTPCLSNSILLAEMVVLDNETEVLG